MKLYTALIASAIALSACAKSPDQVAAVSMNGAYDGMSCASAQRAIVTERQRVAALSASQSRAAQNDALGVFLIGVPVSSVAGGDREAALAAAKGRVNALEARLARC